jgi:Zn-dependent protease with chaperone function
LRKLKGFDTLLKTLNSLVNERAVRLVYLGSAVRVDDRQFPVLHQMLGEVGATLDVETLPELFVTQSPLVQGLAIGLDKPIIVLTSGMVELMDEEELRFVIAHELGHVLSGHAVYQTVLQRLIRLSQVLTAVPIGGLGIRLILAALMEWSRKSELSADRAGLLGTQDPAVAFRVHMKLAGGGDLSNLDPTSFLAQGAEYDAADDVRDSVLKLLLVEARSHPFAVVRASEMRRWVDSGEYTRILGGDYPRRSADGEAKVSAAAQEAANSYQEAFRQTQDVLGRAVHEAAGVVGSVVGWVQGKVKGDGAA